MRNFRIWLAGFQSTWWSRVYSSQIPNQPRNWRGQSFVKSTVIKILDIRNNSVWVFWYERWLNGSSFTVLGFLAKIKTSPSLFLIFRLQDFSNSKCVTGGSCLDVHGDWNRTLINGILFVPPRLDRSNFARKTIEEYVKQHIENNNTWCAEIPDFECWTWYLKSERSERVYYRKDNACSLRKAIIFTEKR
jgi:hypothetical protein